jgi:hypothetical protein
MKPAVAQQGTQHCLTEPVVVECDSRDNSLWCNEFGKVAFWTHALQKGHRPGGGSVRLCVHRLQPMPKAMIFAHEWLAELRWYAMIYGRANPIIASRTQSAVSLFADVVGPIKIDGYRCQHRPTGSPPKHKWTYTLHPMRWWDDENVSSTMYLGVQWV